jgi:hypothetical protein
MPKVLIFDDNEFDPQSGRIQLADRFLPRTKAAILKHLLVNAATATQLINAGLAKSEGAVKTAIHELNCFLGDASNGQKYLFCQNGQYKCVHTGRWHEKPAEPPTLEFRVLPQPVCLFREAHLLSSLVAKGGKFFNSYRQTADNEKPEYLAKYGGDSSVLNIEFAHRCYNAQNPCCLVMIGLRRDDQGRWRSVNLKHYKALKLQARMPECSSRPYINIRLEDSHISSIIADTHPSTEWITEPLNSKKFRTLTIEFERWNANTWPANEGRSVDWGKMLQIVIGYDRRHNPIKGTLELMDIRFV